MMEGKNEAVILKEMRQKLGLSQAKFAERYSIPKRTIENWESGLRKPPQYVLLLLEKVIAYESKNNS